jgi:hypothetical protein
MSKYLDILSILEDFNNLYPDLRLGSIIQTAVDRKKNVNNFNINDLNDKELFSALDEYKTYLGGM